MIVGLVVMAVGFGAACGFAAVFAGFGLIASLAIYCVAGQLPFVIFLAYVALRDVFPSDPDIFSGLSERA